MQYLTNHVNSIKHQKSKFSLKLNTKIDKTLKFCYFSDKTIIIVHTFIIELDDCSITKLIYITTTVSNKITIIIIISINEITIILTNIIIVIKIIIIISKFIKWCLILIITPIILTNFSINAKLTLINF